MDIGKFLQIENAYDLYHDEIDGVNYWIYSRFIIWQYQICSQKLQLGKSQTGIHSVWDILHMVISLTFNTLFPKKILKKCDLCIINHERRVRQEKYFDCIYTEDLVEAYPNCIVLERPYNGIHLKPVKTHNLYYTDYILVKAKLGYLFHKIIRSKHYRIILKEIEKRLEKPLNEIYNSYQLDLPEKTIYQMVAKTIFMYKTAYKSYFKLLEKTAPKVIVEVCHYSMHSMIINEIANKRGIYTIELQHGTIYKEHAAYQYMTNSPIKQLPQKILTFSDFWNENISFPKGTDIIATGFPYFDKQKNKYFYKQKNKENEKVILFISQGTIGKYLSKLAVDFYHATEMERYCIIYKLHPDECSGWRINYPWLEKTKIQVIDTLNHNLYEYFSISDVQIGVYSTALYEGLGFNLKTMIYRKGHYEVMQSLVEQGYAVYVDCAEDITANLMKVNTAAKSKMFWKENAMQNIRNEIEKHRQ